MEDSQLIGIGIVLGMCIVWTFMGVISCLCKEPKQSYKIVYDPDNDTYLLTTENDVHGTYAVATSQNPEELEEKYNIIKERGKGYPKKLE